MQLPPISNMTSIQERLNLKRVPLDKWSVKEQLYLASAVARSGDQNWMSVSRTLKIYCGSARPSDWFSQKSCAAQYGKLLENVETPKRKKRTEKDNAQATVETPSESILRMLTQDRIAELNKVIQDEKRDYTKTKDEILAIQSNAIDENKLREMWVQIETEKKQREKEKQHHTQWLKEREERKIELERAWRPTAQLFQSNSPNQSPLKATQQVNVRTKSEDMEVDDVNLRQGTSPLLTSLLKSPSPAPNPGTPVTLTGTNAPSNSTSSRVVAPTITNLLTGSITSAHISSTAAINSGGQPLISNAFPTQLMTHSLTGPPPYDQASNTNIAQSPSQAAPTLSMLLESKARENASPKMPPLARMDSTTSMRQTEQNFDESNSKMDLFPVGEPIDANEAGSPIKDEDQQLMEVFNGMIPDNIDELADILTGNNANNILNSELLEEESILENVESLMAEQEQEQLVDASANATVAEFNVAIGGFQPGNSHSVIDQTVDICKSIVSLKEDDEDDDDFDNDEVEEEIEEKDETKKEIKHFSPETKAVSDAIVIKDDDQSDFSNDAPLSELLKSDEKKKEAAATKPETEDVTEDEPSDTTKREPDVFESDSNDDMSLESIKREIHELSGLSSDNSNEETVANKMDVQESTDEKISDQHNVNEPPDEPLSTALTSENNADPCAMLQQPLLDADEIVEIKDDKSDDGKTDAFIVIEETDDNNSDELDEVKMETVDIKDDDDEKIPDAKSEPSDRKLSTDDESFKDARETLENLKDDDIETISEPKSVDQTITIFDTDDDSPIEVIKEEDKTGKTKRDYSRKKSDIGSSGNEKRSDETATAEQPIAQPFEETKANLSVRLKLKDRDRSESPYIDDDTIATTPTITSDSQSRSNRRYSSTPILDSLPNSPASSDDREYRAWKKSILMVHNRLVTHKHSPVFMKPITEEQAPGYRSSILRPMDLYTIKRNVDSGITRTTVEFQRDVMLMCENAIMYNSRDHITCTMAAEMRTDALQTIDSIMDTWRKENEKALIDKAAANSSSSQTSKMVRGRKSHRLPPI